MNYFFLKKIEIIWKNGITKLALKFTPLFLEIERKFSLIFLSIPGIPWRPVWIIRIEFHSNNSNLGIYQLS
jgi:hypothetical protein